MMSVVILPRTARVVVFWPILGALAVSSACNDHNWTRNRTEDSHPSDLLLLVWEHPGPPIPGQPVIKGLVIAVWEDGRIVRREGQKHSATRPGVNVDFAYVEDKLDRGQLDQLKTSFQYGRLKKIKNQSVTLDVGWESTYVRCGAEFIELCEARPWKQAYSIKEDIRNLVYSFELKDPHPLSEAPALEPPRRPRPRR